MLLIAESCKIVSISLTFRNLNRIRHARSKLLMEFGPNSQLFMIFQHQCAQCSPWVACWVYFKLGFYEKLSLAKVFLVIFGRFLNNTFEHMSRVVTQQSTL